MTLILIILTLSACTTTKTVIEYREVTVKPPESLLTECTRPFDERPKKYGEAAERDEIWRFHFDKCALKIKKNKEFNKLD
jgi:hypothetical protein